MSRITRRDVITLLGGAAVAWPPPAHAQQPQLPVIGYLSGRSREAEASMLVGFRRGLAETGFVEKRDVEIDFRFADGRLERLPALARDLVGRQLAAIVAVGGIGSANAAHAANPSLPIVFNVGTDPVQLGLVENFNRPGGMMTGIFAVQGELAKKNLGLLHELVPKATRIAVLMSRPLPAAQIESLQGEAREAAVTLGLQLRMFNITLESELNAAIATPLREPPEAMLLLTGPLLISNAQQIVVLAARLGIPAIYNRRDYPTAGGLMSYGDSVAESYRYTGNYAGRILKGAKPSDLPVFQTNKLELVINLKTARTLGLAIPATLLAIADEVIE